MEPLRTSRWSSATRLRICFQILDVPVPQTGNQVVEFVQKIDAPSLVEQVIAVPKISLDRIPQRPANRRPQKAQQLVEVPTIVSLSSPLQQTASALSRVERGECFFRTFPESKKIRSQPPVWVRGCPPGRAHALRRLMRGCLPRTSTSSTTAPCGNRLGTLEHQC